MVFSFFAFENPKKQRANNVAISVIICAKNEAENLKKHLPLILNQAYNNFEVVLINDASSDDTLDIFEDFALKHSNIKIVNVKNNETFWGNKKYALTLGIKAASYEHLLFTDADCKPKSKFWIQEMSNSFNEESTIVIGYGAYAKKKNSFLNLLIRYETLLTAIQYFSYAKIGSPFMGVGRNLAYTKSVFFDVNGFNDHIKIRSGDDDLFINQVATKKNTNINYNSDSFTVSKPEESYKKWLQQKRRHISTANYYKPKHKIALGLFYMVQILFYIFSILLLTFAFKWVYVLIIIGIKYAIQIVVYAQSAKKIKETKTIYFLPILEVTLLLSQLLIFIINSFSKPTHWK